MTAVAGAVALGSVMTADQGPPSFDLFDTKIIPRVYKEVRRPQAVSVRAILHGAPAIGEPCEMKLLGRA